MLRVVILLALLIGLGYAAYRWHRRRLLAEELRARKQRHLEQQEAWDRMLAETAGERGVDARPGRAEA